MINFLPFHKTIHGKTVKAVLKPDKIAGPENTEYLCGKAGNANFVLCTSKNNGFSLVTDKGYLSVNPKGQVYCCNTIDNNGKKQQLYING